MSATKMLSSINVGEVSAKYESLFTPAGTTFSIWGIIYISLGMLCLYHIISAYKHDRTHAANTELVQISGLFIITNLASIAWLIAWTQERLLVSVVLIFLQLACLIAIHIRLGIYDPRKPAELKMATHLPLSIYLGWISIASIANTSSYLTAIGWDGMGLTQVQWMVVMLSIAIVLALVMLFWKKNVYFALVVAWGLYGIILKRDQFNSHTYEPFINIAWGGIGVILVCAVIQIVRNLTLRKKKILFPVSPASVK
jgi:hypothetical protein